MDVPAFHEYTQRGGHTVTRGEQHSLVMIKGGCGRRKAAFLFSEERNDVEACENDQLEGTIFPDMSQAQYQVELLDSGCTKRVA